MAFSSIGNGDFVERQQLFRERRQRFRIEQLIAVRQEVGNAVSKNLLPVKPTSCHPRSSIRMKMKFSF